MPWQYASASPPAQERATSARWNTCTTARAESRRSREYTYDKEGRIDTVTEKDLGYLNDAREQVDSSGNPTSDPDLEFDRVTKYYYGTFFGVEKVSD